LARVACADARRLGVRLIAPERPGCGRSCAAPERTLLSWPADVLEFADALGIDRFAVVGFSAGGPYAAACAHLLPPERLIAAAIVNGVAPHDAGADISGMRLSYRAGFALARRFPALTEWPWG